jgi:hypothetical protein
VTELVAFSTAICTLAKVEEVYADEADSSCLLVHYSKSTMTTFEGTELRAGTRPHGRYDRMAPERLWTYGFSLGDLRVHPLACVNKLKSIIMERTKEHKVPEGLIFIMKANPQTIGAANAAVAKRRLEKTAAATSNCTVQLETPVRVFLSEETRETRQGILLYSIDIQAASLCTPFPRTGVQDPSRSFVSPEPGFVTAEVQLTDSCDLIVTSWERACRAQRMLMDGLDRFTASPRIVNLGDAQAAALELEEKVIARFMSADASFVDATATKALLHGGTVAASDIREICVARPPDLPLEGDAAALVGVRFEFMPVMTRRDVNGVRVDDARVEKRLADAFGLLVACGIVPETRRLAGGGVEVRGPTPLGSSGSSSGFRTWETP